MSPVEGDDQHTSRSLLRALIERVRDEQPISHLVAPSADVEPITAQLRPLCGGPVEIESIVGNLRRTDAVVTVERAVVRVVFGRDLDGQVIWLHSYVKPPSFARVDGGRVIVVNGPSGSGKSTLMSALQSLAPFPLVVLDEPEHIGTVQPGYLIWRDSAPALHRGYLAAIRALAETGNHVAISAAGHRHGEIADVFSGVSILRVGLHCDLSVLVDREQRTGRWAGIAAQSLNDHDGWTYELEFDTTSCPDPLELARHVLDCVGR